MGQPPDPNGAPALPINDFAALSLDLVQGGRADVTVSGISVLGDEGVRICVVLHGEEGSIEVVHRLLGSQAGAQVRGLRKGDQTFATLPVPPEFLEGGVDSKQLFDPYVKQSAGARRFIDAIRSGATIDTDFEVGMRVQEIVDAALLSASEDRRVTLSAP
jgi:predicted dehydrogenase